MRINRWFKHPELLERVVRLRAEGKFLREIAEILGFTECKAFQTYRSKWAKRLCRKLDLPYYYKSGHRPKRETYSYQTIETFVRLRYTEGRSWQEIAQATGHGWAGARMACYSKIGKEIRQRLGYYKTKNVRCELAGRKFGRLKVVRFAGRNAHGNAVWRCKCSCGALTTVPSSFLVRGLTKTCGDISHRPRGKNHPTYKHGGCTKKFKPTWTSYMSMRRRCLDLSDLAYSYYGGRGIQICARWRMLDGGFLRFLADVGRRPKNKTLDRIYPHGHYSCGHCEQCVANEWPMNVKWSTDKQQANNKQRHYPPLTEDEKAKLAQFSDPYREEVVF